MSTILDMTIPDEMKAALAAAGARVDEAKAAYDQARADREALVREVASNGGKYREIAHVGGLSYQRVGQIVTGSEPPALNFMAPLEIPCPTCGAKAGDTCPKASGVFHTERSDERMQMWLAEHPELA